MEVPAIHGRASPASQDGQRLSRLLIDVTAHARLNASDWRSLTNALIEEIAVECSRPNWDGYGAAPIQPGAKEQAQRFVDLLPYWLPPPDPVPDPDGELGLSWDFGPGHVLSVNISADGTLTYAGLLGNGVKRHGVEKFGSEIPKVVLQSIDELCQRARAAG
jgi:hypothetical protein